ncbi:MAG: DUF2293 domain-containing protein [Acidobacteriota bacterium]|nr:DUF2293 domain-containing protein [Acidobacteriota bacterium]
MRHQNTDYDSLLMGGLDRASARAHDAVDRLLEDQYGASEEWS